MASDRRPRGLFVGLATLDVIHRVERVPGSDEKVTALRQDVVAGGPAANAAVTFSALGGDAVLVSAVGDDPVGRMISAELASHGVTVIDLADAGHIASVSSVMVEDATGHRAVVGGDGGGARIRQVNPAAADAWLADIDVVLTDGHHPAIAEPVVARARVRDLPVVLDAGRWKPGMEAIAHAATDVVASEVFRWPGAGTSEESAAAALDAGARVAAYTSGAGPVRWWTAEDAGEVRPPVITAVDTLGAGDAFHGAYTFALARGRGVAECVDDGARVAARRVAVIGPREWMRGLDRV